MYKRNDSRRGGSLEKIFGINPWFRSRYLGGIDNDRLQLAIDLIADGKVDTDQLVTHRFSFPQTNEAFSLVNDYSDGVMKALIEF